MVEEARAGEGHVHAVFLARLDHLRICHGPSRLRNILHPILTGVVDRVSKWEECVRRQAHTRQSRQKRALLCVGKRGRGLREVLNPLLVLCLGNVTTAICVVALKHDHQAVSNLLSRPL